MVGSVDRDAAGTADRRFAMLLGGFDAQTRHADILSGRRPSNDIEVLGEEMGAEILDFSWLEARAGSSRTRRLVARIARRTGQWSAALALMTALEVRKFETVYVSGEDVAVPAGLLSRLLPGPHPFFIVRIERPVYGRTSWRRAIHRWAFRVASRDFGVALCRTAAIARVLEGNTSMPPERLVALGQEIDTDFFNPDIPAALTLDIPGPFILSAGLERRDYGTLLRAVDQMPVTLVIAAGSPWSKESFDVEMDLPENVLVSSFNAMEMRELYRQCQLVVLSIRPTERACGMNVIGEAWAMRRPVVASQTEGISEFIRSGENGLLVTPGDADELRSAITSVLESEELAETFANRGRRDVCQSLSLSHFRSTVDEVYMNRRPGCVEPAGAGGNS